MWKRRFSDTGFSVEGVGWSCTCHSKFSFESQTFPSKPLTSEKMCLIGSRPNCVTFKGFELELGVVGMTDELNPKPEIPKP